MTYRTGASFRRALENRLRTRSLETGAPLVRLRKMVIFDRFLGRLIQDQPGAWVLKGGLALQLRLADQARTTRDIDVLLTQPSGDRQAIHQALVRAALLDLGDWFGFEVGQPAAEVAEVRGGGVRCPVQGLLDGRRFEIFHIDVGWGDPLLESADVLRAPAFLDFAGITPTSIPCYPVTQQIAEKLHAYTRPRASGQGSRVKDLVDILLIAELGQMDGGRLAQALAATFEARRTHPLPGGFPDPPSTWSGVFGRLAQETGLCHRTLKDAVEGAGRFLNPVLRGEEAGRWDPGRWSWTP